MRIESVMHACYNNMMFGQHNVIILLACANFFFNSAHVLLFIFNGLMYHVLLVMFNGLMYSVQAV